MQKLQLTKAMTNVFNLIFDNSKFYNSVIASDSIFYTRTENIDSYFQQVLYILIWTS